MPVLFQTAQFLQRVSVPARSQHVLVDLKLLRLAVVGVAIFAFCFGALFTQTEYVGFWFLVTMAIYIGGAGACIIGGLYWSRGTTAGAWTALVVGSVLATGGVIIRQFDAAFALNVVRIGFIANIAASSSYVIVSQVTCRKLHNMDRLLNRGPYAVEPEADGESVHPITSAGDHQFNLDKVVGIDEHFSPGDRWVTWGIFLWSVRRFIQHPALHLLNLIFPLTDTCTDRDDASITGTNPSAEQSGRTKRIYPFRAI